MSKTVGKKNGFNAVFYKWLITKFFK